MALVAGRELDALVAEKVFGYAIWPATESRKVGIRPSGTKFKWDPLPEYSTDIAAAWLVVERLMEKGLTQGRSVKICTDGLHMAWDLIEKSWSVGYTESMDADCNKKHFQYDDDSGGFAPAKADTLPLAICVFALKAIGHEELAPWGPQA